MSVLIKGMDMPKCDIDCPIFTEEICPVESVLAFSKMKEERPPDCPLVPVPTPHGRLGDLDAVEAEIREKTNEQFCVNIVHAAPTIIPAEEGEA